MLKLPVGSLDKALDQDTQTHTYPEIPNNMVARF